MLRWRSTDRGRSWDGPVPFEDWPVGADFAADPWLVTDNRGQFHLIHLATSLKDRQVCPAVYRRSSDGGATWAAPVQIAAGADRPVLAVSPSGRRLAAVTMMADASAAPLTAAELLDAPPARALAASNRVLTAGVFRSADGGASWGRIPGPPAVRHAPPFSAAIDDAGRIAASWVVNDGRGSYSMVGTTADGGATWAEEVVARRLQPDRPHPFTGGRFPLVALDGSGRLHALFVEAGGVAVSVQVSRDWVNWSAPTRLSGDRVAGVRFPALTAAGDVVHATWMEQVGDRFQMRHRASKDGGTHWSEPLTLSHAGAGLQPEAEAGFLIVSEDDQTAVADDGCGTAHAVWAVRTRPDGKYAILHAAIDWQIPGR